uniref:F-box protein At5g03100-like n=1 Tax=Nicotiana tabacum TaxID=4097 RepID=A0A1S3ZLJ7_TOBAC|nr:PREDICTED: F-box protein At5g03100-like [Nicotiana tabacum]
MASVDLGNPSNKQTVTVTGVEETLDDRISQLPDSLLIQILSLLPTKEAFKTCILSKRWQYLCTSVYNLNFTDAENMRQEAFISYVDYALARCTSSKIKKFQLTFGWQHVYWSQYSQWLAFAVEKRVEHVELKSFGDDYDIFTLPQFICTCSSLITLKLIRCALDKEVIIAWKSLKSLVLIDMVLDGDDIVNLLSGSPALETLEFNLCMGFRRLEISSSNLKRLNIKSWRLLDVEDDHSLEIFAPYLQHLEISGSISDLKCRLLNVSSLVNAKLTFKIDCEKDIQDWNGYYVDDAEDSCRDYHQSFIIVVQDYLQKLSNVTNLTIGTWLTEVLCMLQLEEVPIPELKCKYLTLELHLKKLNLYGVASLLRASPHVETLNIDMATMSLHDSFCHFKLRYLAKGDNVDLRRWTSSFVCPSLKNVKIINSLGVCLKDHFTQGCDKLFELSKFLLKNATVLEKFFIISKTRKCRRCSTDCVSRYFFQLAEKLLGCPRSSTNSVIIFQE